jgi:hypothetical protein
MNRTLSIAISSVFHPVFVNLLGLLALIFLSPYLSMGLNPTARFFYVAFIFISAGILPMVVVLMMKLLGRIQSVMLEVQDERNIPYLVTASIYLFDYYFLSRLHTPAILCAYILACACIVVAVVIINHFYKISIHATSLGALLAIIVSSSTVSIIDIRFMLVPVLIITGITLSARLFLLAHTRLQLLSGWVLGFLIMYFIL